MRRTAKTLCLLAGMLILPIGCKDAEGKQGFRLQNAFTSMFPPSPDEQVKMAFHPTDPDKRREGITLLAKNAWGLQEPYLEGYAKIIRTDEDASVRCAAARALGRAAEPNYVPALADALGDVSPEVRWQAALALDGALSARRGDPRNASAKGPLQKRALQDASPDVRACCAKALRNFQDKEVLKTLVQCLYDESFGVRYLAHAALVELAGRDVGTEPEQWAPITEGALPPAPPPPAKPWWDWMGVTANKTGASTQPTQPGK